MKIKINFLIAIFTIVLLSQCNKEDKTSKAYFYSSVPNGDQLSLYINDNYHGKIPYLNVEPDCQTDSLMQKTLFFNLKHGRHIMTAKDMYGNIKSSANVRVSKHKLSVDGRAGSQRMSKEDNCVVFGFSY